jgi:hypothetical protein
MPGTFDFEGQKYEPGAMSVCAAVSAGWLGEGVSVVPPMGAPDSRAVLSTPDPAVVEFLTAAPMPTMA